MRALLLLHILCFPLITVAQFDNATLDQIAWTLSMNRRTSSFFVGINSRRQMIRFDTMAITGANLHQRAMFERDIAMSVALLEKSTQLDPKQHRNAGRTYFTTYRDYSRALHHFDAFDALTPDFDDTDGISPISYHKGLCYRGLGNHAEAVRQFSKGIDSLAKKHGSEWVNYKHYISRAISYLAMNQFDKALLDLDAALKNCTSESPLALYYKGQVFLKQGRTTDAKRTFQDAQFFWQANRVKGISQPEDYTNPVTEADIDEALKK